MPLRAEEIFDTGVAEVARIQGEMEAIKAQVGFEGTLQDFFGFIRSDDRFYHPNTDAGRAAYIADADAILEATYAKLPEFFGILPKAGLQVKRVEPFREQDGGAAHYARGTKDGSRPGTFYAHLSDMRAASKHRLENLAYHEGVPGHHMQISIQQELDSHQRFATCRSEQRPWHVEHDDVTIQLALDHVHGHSVELRAGHERQKPLDAGG